MASHSQWHKNSIQCVSPTDVPRRSSTSRSRPYLSGRRINVSTTTLTQFGSLSGCLFEQITHIPSACNKELSKSSPEKIQSINQLAHLARGANTITLRSSAVALNIAFLRWAVRQSSHVKLVNRQLNETMRIVSVTIAPPAVRRIESSLQTPSIISKENFMFLLTFVSLLNCRPRSWCVSVMTDESFVFLAQSRFLASYSVASVASPSSLTVVDSSSVTQRSFKAMSSIALLEIDAWFQRTTV